MTREQYLTILRICAFVAAISLWGVSVYFSQDGFGIKVPNLNFVGIILALSVTVIELVFNRDGTRHNYTLLLAGMLAYSYGVWSNVIGIMAAQGNGLELSQEMIFPIILALFLEIVPEPLMLWSLMGVNFDDLLSKMFSRQSEPGLRIPPSNSFGGDERPVFTPGTIAERKHPAARPSFIRFDQK